MSLDAFADELVLFPALRFCRFGGCLAGHLSQALFALPPFNEVIALSRKWI
jgi:hypothetical protein